MSEQAASALGRWRPLEGPVSNAGALSVASSHGVSSAPIADEPLFHVSWTRSVAAIRRYKWLALGIAVAGVGLGFAATRMVAPEYEVHATVWITNNTERTGERTLGPIRAGEVMRETSWPDLLTSFAILEKAVRKTSLYLRPSRAADSTAFVGFNTAERFRTGAYELKISGPQYQLLSADGSEIESGGVGDSIGRRVGFLWKPSAASVSRTRSIKFALVTPRAAAMDLRDEMAVSFPPESNLLRVTLTGSDPQRITMLMNAVLQEFITQAAELKKRSVSEAGKALAAQVASAGKQLQDAESALEAFRVQTITLPTEDEPIAGAAERPRDPLSESYFTQKIEAENIRRDRVALEATLAAVQRDQLDPSALWSVPAVQGSPAPELKAALAEFATKQAALRAAQRTYTDDHKVVRDLKAQLAEVKTQTIPRLAEALIAEQKRREVALDGQVQSTAQQLRAIPVRTTQETRLRRDVEVRGTLYSTLKNKYEEALLAEASTVPDVSILDAPAAPEQPSHNRAPHIILMAALASIALAVAVVLLLDRVDRRFHYAEQATNEMGLDVIGIVPALTQVASELRDPVEAAHAREAFRSIRLAVMHAFDDAGRAMVTISSPGPGDGKSLLSSDLAQSFADANFRTLLIDGDIRRGELHAKFGVERLPGFVDYLAGGLTLDQVLRPTTHDKLTLLPRGASQLHGPELLLSPTMSDLMEQLQREFDVIIVDSPPLGAGIDPFVLGTTTGSMLLVLRSGETDRKMALAKLKVLNRLPVRVIGAVLNATPAEGDFRYYSYLYSDSGDDGARKTSTQPLPAVADRDVTATQLHTS